MDPYSLLLSYVGRALLGQLRRQLRRHPLRLLLIGLALALLGTAAGLFKDGVWTSYPPILLRLWAQRFTGN